MATVLANAMSLLQPDETPTAEPFSDSAVEDVRCQFLTQMFANDPSMMRHPRSHSSLKLASITSRMVGDTMRIMKAVSRGKLAIPTVTDAYKHLHFQMTRSVPLRSHHARAHNR
jgi:hypothetical protein